MKFGPSEKKYHCYRGLNKDKLPKMEVKFMTISLDEKKNFLVSRIKGKKRQNKE
jgi:hypothetical protein